MPPSYSSGLEYLNDALAALFTAEMALKIYAFGPRAYFMDPWSQFDAAVVVLSDVGIILTLAGGLSVGAIGTLARVLRLGRVVRLAKALKSLRQMVSTLILVMPQLFNVGACVLRNSPHATKHQMRYSLVYAAFTGLLLFLLIFIYAIAGVQLFAFVGLDGQYLVAQSNFQSVGLGMLMLFRWTTGENWNLQVPRLPAALDRVSRPPSPPASNA